MKKSLMFMIILALLAGVLSAQESPKETSKEATSKAEAKPPADTKPLSAYKLEFVLRELQNGKVANVRNYSLIATERSFPAGELKIGSRVPVKSNEVSFNYLDVGTSIRCNSIRAESPWVFFDCSVEVSSFSLPEQQVTSGTNVPPVLNQMRSSIGATVPEGKQTIIGVLDDPSSTKRYEIAVTATKITTIGDNISRLR